MLCRLFLVLSMVTIVFAMGCDEADEPSSEEDNEELQEFVSAQLDVEFRLEVGEKAIVESEDIEITLMDVPEDSRCPSDVVCVWEGRVEVVVSIMKDEADLGDFSLTGNGTEEEATAIFDGYSVKLLLVEPYPVSTEPIEIPDYIITLMISKVT